MQMEINAGDFLDIITCAKKTHKEEGVIVFKDDKWLLKTKGPANILMHAVRVPRESMERYDRRGVEQVGIDYNWVEKFIDSRSGTLGIQLDGHSLHLYQGDDHINMGTISPDQIDAAVPGLPNVDYEVVFDASPSVLMDFAEKVKDYVTDGAIYISPREDALYLYHASDNYELDRRIDWDDIEGGPEFNWEINNLGREGCHIPKDDHAADVLQDIQALTDMKLVTDTVSIYTGNYIPLKVVMNLDSGIDMSYIQAPRMAEEGTMPHPPEEVTSP